MSHRGLPRKSVTQPTTNDLEAQLDALLDCVERMALEHEALKRERDQLRARVARMTNKQEKARDRLNQIGERIKALEASS